MVKNNLLFILLIIVLAIFQLSFVPVIFSFPSTPDLLLVFVIATSLLFDFPTVLKWAVISGLISDFFSYQKLGISAIVFVLAAYLCSFFSRRFSIETRLGSFLIIVFLVIVSTFSYRFSAIILNYHLNNILIILRNVDFYNNLFKEIVFNLILFVPIFYLIKKIRPNSSSNIYNLVRSWSKSY